MSDNDRLVFNGINMDTGDYLLDPMSLKDFAARIKGEQPRDKGLIEQLKSLLTKRQGKFMGVVPWVEHPENIAEAGWGVVFASKGDPAVREALEPLLERRKQQAGDYYREYSAAKGFMVNDTKPRWLARQGASADGPANPAKVPYYLLIVGDPQTIPYEFQYQLDVQYAVGRIHFDAIADYEQYARSVVAAETSQAQPNMRAVFFGVRNGADPSTALSVSKLVEPLADALDGDQQNREPKRRWTVECETSGTTRDRLKGILSGSNPPLLLFTAGHGLGGFNPGDARQAIFQGALVCEDWQGPGAPVRPEQVFSGEDASDGGGYSGLITFHFACYGAGTPLRDDFPQGSRTQRNRVAASPFVARLPKKLLSHPKGGALASVGHIERSWSYSFLGEGDPQQASPQLEVYRSTLTQLMRGCPVGMAMEYFNQRFAELAVSWKEQQDNIAEGVVVSDSDVAGLWMANNDARNFVVVGDPAVRLQVPG